jgi:hypothetical protein
MVTWSAAIYGNDTSCEVKEYFFEQYNLGKEPVEIRREILGLYDKANEETYDVLFALAHCLWQTKTLDGAFHAEIRRIVAARENLDALKALGASEKFLRERGKALGKLLLEIETPREIAKTRRKPPVTEDSIYRNGCCLAFRYPDDDWGVAITVCSEFFRRKAQIAFAQTDVKQAEIPTMKSVSSAHLLDNSFHRNQFAQKLHLYLHFLGSKEIARLNPYIEAFFTIIGHLPEWKDAYGSSSSGRQPYNEETREGFARVIGGYFSHLFANRERTVETVAEIGRIFAVSND